MSGIFGYRTAELPRLFALLHLLLVLALLAFWLLAVDGPEGVWRLGYLDRVMRMAGLFDFPAAQVSMEVLAGLGLSTNPAVVNALAGSHPRDLFLLIYWLPLVTLGTLQWWLLGVGVKAFLGWLVVSPGSPER